MTFPLFFQSDDLEANVPAIDCRPQGNEFAVLLRSTLFHPQGGGQPSDTGWIGDSLVLRVTQELDRIIHFVDRPVKTGMTQIRVDEQRRRFNTRMHSAGHLIGHFVQAMGWTPIKAHHWPGEGRVQFKPIELAQEVDSKTIQNGIEQWISHDLPRITSVRGIARKISFGELPAYGCGGTHVRSLKDLGSVTITSVTKKKGTLSVHYSVD